jgi:hypothetical protein
MMITDASVAGSALLSFAHDISERERIAVTYALRYAQQAAADLYTQQQGGDWHGYFRRQLRFLGWDAQPSTHPYNPDRQRQRVLDAALDTLQAQGPRFEHLAAAGVQALELDDEGLLLLERYARRHQTGMFQLLPCARGTSASGVALVDMLVYHEELSMQSASQGCLTADDPPPRITCRLGLIRFNARAFESTHLPKIMARFARPWEDDHYMRLLSQA